MTAPANEDLTLRWLDRAAGTIEPTIGRLRDGSYLLVMRGSNDRKPELPGWRRASGFSEGPYAKRWTPVGVGFKPTLFGVNYVTYRSAKRSR